MSKIHVAGGHRIVVGDAGEVVIHMVQEHELITLENATSDESFALGAAGALGGSAVSLAGAWLASPPSSPWRYAMFVCLAVTCAVLCGGQMRKWWRARDVRQSAAARIRARTASVARPVSQLPRPSP